MSLPRLLIVEDSVLVTDALRILFEESGYNVTIAHDAASAVRLGLAERPELMLLDLTLPDGSGLSVLRELAVHDASPRATVALTGHDDDELRDECLRAGCAAVLIKPVPVSQLLELVRSL